MKAVFIRVDQPNLLLDWLEIDRGTPFIKRYLGRNFRWGDSAETPSTFVRHDFLFQGVSYPVYTWELLDWKHPEIKKTLVSFLEKSIPAEGGPGIE